MGELVYLTTTLYSRSSIICVTFYMVDLEDTGNTLFLLSKFYTPSNRDYKFRKAKRYRVAAGSLPRLCIGGRRIYLEISRYDFGYLNYLPR
jgi:hypothetical protein